MLAATRSSSAKVIDTDSIMGAAEDMADVIQAAVVAVETELLKMKNEPWMVGLGVYQLEREMRQVLLREKLMRGIRQVLDKDLFEIVPPLAFEQPSLLRKVGYDTMVMRSFWVCLGSLERVGQIIVSSPHSRKERYKKEYLRVLRRRVSSIGGYFVTRMASLLLCENSKEGCSQRRAKADLVLAGLQATDALFQAPLAQRLSTRYRDAFLWLTYSKQTIMRRALAIMPEEEAIFDAMGNKGAYCTISDQVPLVVWRHPIFARLADAYAYWKMAGILSGLHKSNLSIEKLCLNVRED